MLGEVVYEGSAQFEHHKAKADAVSKHKADTGHQQMWDGYWETRCHECGWEVRLSTVSGDPFNPNTPPAVMRVRVYPPREEAPA